MRRASCAGPGIPKAPTREGKLKLMSEHRLQLWTAPTATGPISWTQAIPGSKSMTNRAYILAALAAGPSRIIRPLASRDTDLMAAALQAMGTTMNSEPSPDGRGLALGIIPGPLHGADIDCGLAGTVMRFIPPLAALADGTVRLDGDPQARKRPMGTMAGALRDLGISVSGDSLPLTISSAGVPEGGTISIDASASSQFVSGLLLSAPRYRSGLTVHHHGGPLPSIPHIDMTVAMLTQAGVKVESSDNSWRVYPGEIAGRDWVIEPDLSNATPFMAAAAVAGGSVSIPDWPADTTQPGAAMIDILRQMGAEVTVDAAAATVTVTGTGTLRGIERNMRDIGELTPTVAALAALADSPSLLSGIGHLRGHETDRLAALAADINGLGGQVEETADGLRIYPAPLHGGLWRAYADHRMATAGAIIGLRVPGVQIDDIGATSKTLPGFEQMWTGLCHSVGSHG